MATLTYEDGTTITELEPIARALAPLGVALANWPTAEGVSAILAKAALGDAEKAEVLEAHTAYFQQLQEESAYKDCDLIVLHPDIPGLLDLLKKFESCHTHDDDEVRYIVDGEGIFGFVRPDGSQVELTVEAGEYINVPADTEHWFHLTEAMRIKAVRYFTGTDGWTPRYTETPIRFAWAVK